MKQKIIQWILNHKIATFLWANIIMILISLLWTEECNMGVCWAVHRSFLNPFGVTEHTMDQYLSYFDIIEPIQCIGTEIFKCPRSLTQIGWAFTDIELSPYFYIFSDILIVVLVGLFLTKVYQYFFKKS